MSRQRVRRRRRNRSDSFRLFSERLEDRRLLAPVATNDDYTASDPITEDQVLTISDGPTDLLANDTPSNVHVVAYDSASANGAAVTVNADGSFSYDPTEALALQSLRSGDMVTDTFSYTITDNTLDVTSGLALWLDASDAATLFEDEAGTDLAESGDGIAAWKDKSGNNHLFTQPTSADRPITGIAASSTGANVLDLSNDYLVGPAGILAANDDDYTYVTVWNADTNHVGAVYEQGQGANQRSSVLLVNANYGFNGQSNDAHDLVPYSSGTWNVSMLTIDNPASPNLNIVHNGTNFSRDMAGKANLSVGTNGTRVGAKVSNNAERFDGKIAEILVYDRVLTPAELTSVGNYLSATYVTGSDTDAATVSVTVTGVDE